MAMSLCKLLNLLEYKNGGLGYFHPTRKVIFLDDFIDRGKHLRQYKKLLAIVMEMVDNGHALSVMGNHEFNALAYHTYYKGKPLRSHSLKHTKQH